MTQPEHKTADELSQEAMTLIVDSSHGIYVPQRFAETHNMEEWGISPEDATILCEGPENKLYWDAWDDVCTTAEYVDAEGHQYALYCCEGDVFVVNDTTIEKWENQTGLSFWDEYNA